MMSVTRLTAATISSMVWPDCVTSMEPRSTRSTESPISALISLAAVALRCARLRTSPATTAKPRPCSPARAASTAAFSARMLVWKAMPSITPMMSTIFLDASLISSMVCTTRPTTSPPRSAVSDALAASPLAWRALSAFWRTVPVSCSMLDAVCSSDAACCSVRCDRSLLPAATWCVAVEMLAMPSWISCTTDSRLRCMVCIACASAPISSLPRCSKRVVRSPAPMRSAKSSMSRTGRCTRASSMVPAANEVASASAKPPHSHGRSVAAPAGSRISTAASAARNHTSPPACAHRMRRFRFTRSARCASPASPVRTTAPSRIASPAARPARKRAYSAPAASTCSGEGIERTEV
ncbi:hypothetical protein D9M70_433590 [compost metagenome]